MNGLKYIRYKYIKNLKIDKNIKRKRNLKKRLGYVWHNRLSSVGSTNSFSTQPTDSR